jgi:hypothetical protein
MAGETVDKSGLASLGGSEFKVKESPFELLEQGALPTRRVFGTIGLAL